jgi:4-amino-4-deoxychorismate lyase
MSSFRQLTMVNNIFVDQLSVTDRGLAFGDGLFETMRLTAGRIPLLDYHLERLDRGCQALAIPVSRILLESSLETFIAAVSDPAPSIIKLIITRGSGGQGCKPPSIQASRPSIIWQSLPLGDNTQLSRTGVTLQSCRVPIYTNPHLAGIKHLNRLNYVMAALDLPANPAVQGLLTDEKGNILESLHHNLFFVKNDRLMTPLLSGAGVKGVLRRLILERLAPSCSLSVEEVEFSIDELLLADEVFLTNGVRGIWPVKALAATQWPAPGPITAKLQSLVEAIFIAGKMVGGEREG